VSFKRATVCRRRTAIANPDSDMGSARRPKMSDISNNKLKLVLKKAACSVVDYVVTNDRVMNGFSSTV
jgi:hypothetical protein